jgi:hypothetical protein
MKSVTIPFSKEKVLYDVSQTAYVIADSVEKTNAHQLHQLTDITQEGNIDIVNNTLSIAFSELQLLMGKNLREEEKPQPLTLYLSVSDNFVTPHHNLLSDAGHYYLVWRILYDFCQLSYPDYIPVCGERIESYKKLIRDAVKYPSGKIISRPLYPYSTK